MKRTLTLALVAVLAITPCYAKPVPAFDNFNREDTDGAPPDPVKLHKIAESRTQRDGLYKCLRVVNKGSAGCGKSVYQIHAEKGLPLYDEPEGE